MSPSEPITAGASFGPGLTPMQAGISMMGPQNNAVNELRSISKLYPDSGISDLLDKYGE
jgi:hypothetical protein